MQIVLALYIECRNIAGHKKTQQVCSLRSIIHQAALHIAMITMIGVFMIRLHSGTKINQPEKMPKLMLNNGGLKFRTACLPYAAGVVKYLFSQKTEGSISVSHTQNIGIIINAISY